MVQRFSYYDGADSFCVFGQGEHYAVCYTLLFIGNVNLCRYVERNVKFMLKEQIENLLLQVKSPSRYIGGEFNSVVKDKSQVDVSAGPAERHLCPHRAAGGRADLAADLRGHRGPV